MTDVLDRLDTEPISRNAVEASAVPDDLRPRITLAALSVGAASVHLAMVPAHLGEWAPEGRAFLVTAWIQLGIAILAVARPSRRLWQVTIVLTSAFVGAWAVSRTSGLPFGPQKGVAEDMEVLDFTVVAFELALILGALAMLALRPARRASRSWLLAPVVPLALIGVITAVLASPGATEHAHGADGHTDDPVLAALAAKGFGSFMNGHEHAHVEVALDPATQTELDRQLAITREVAAQYPTMQDALDAGYKRAGPYAPGLGAHLVKLTGGAEYNNADGIIDDADLRHPLSIMYASDSPDAEVSGFMYYAGTATEPAGFPGRNDGWHYHEHICLVSGPDGIDIPFGPDFAATRAQCESVGGALIDSQWMVHVWSVPGWDDMADYGGVFAEMNPQLACSDGTYFQLPFDEWHDQPTNTCRSGAAGQPEL